MKKLLTIATLATLSFAKFSEELIEKYSIEIINEGDEGTEPKSGDSV